jgi:hypothetical protein
MAEVSSDIPAIMAMMKVRVRVRVRVRVVMR